MAPQAEKAYGKSLQVLSALPRANFDQRTQLGENWIRWGQVAAYMQRRDLALERFEKAASWHAELMHEQPRSFLIRVNMARSLLLLGSMQVRMNQPARASKTYDQCYAILKGLVQEQPAYPDLRVILADLLSRSADVDHDANRLEAEEIKFAEAEALFDVLWRESQGLPALPSVWLAHVARRSTILLRAGRFAEAKKALTRAEELPELDLTKTNLADIDKLCRALRNLATLARRQKDWDQAERIFDRIVLMRRWVLERVPNEAGFKQSLAYALNNLSNLYRQTQRKDQARKTLREAIDLKREGLTLTPESAGRTYSLALSLHNLAGLTIEAELKQDAALLLEEAVTLQEQAVRLQDVNRHRVMLGNSLEARALLQLDLGNSSLLLGAADRIGKLLPKRSSTPYRVCLLLCRHLANAPTDLNAATRSKLEERATTQLQLAVQRKRPTRKELETDPRFDPIRSSPAFEDQFGTEGKAWK